MIKADAGLTGRLFFKAGFSHVTGSGGKQEAGGDFSPFSSIILSVVKAASPERLPSFNWTQNKSKVSVAAEKRVSV